MRSGLILLSALAASVVVGCASPGLPHLPLYPASAFTDGERTATLDLGGAGEVFIRPRLLATGYDSSPVSPEDIRLQVLLRVVLRDGGVITWALGSDGDAPRSEGGRRWRPEQRGDISGIELGGARLGPIAVDKIEAIEVLAAWLRSPAVDRARYQGVFALGSAPELGAHESSWDATGQEVERLGAAALLAARVPLSRVRARGPGQHNIRLAVVAPGPSGDPPQDLRFTASVGEKGAPWPAELSSSNLCVVVLDLNLQVHPTRP